VSPDLEMLLAERRRAGDIAAAERLAQLQTFRGWRLRLPAIDVTIRLEIRVASRPARA
jgi:hypothetical protein